MRARALLCLALVLVPAGSGAEGWAGFYTPSTPEPPPMPAVPPAPRPAGPVGRQIVSQDLCTSAILAAEQRYNIPGHLLLAIGLQEAGMRRQGRVTVWPWSVNAAGDGRMFRSEAQAVQWVQAQQAIGVTSIDVGCMQVNLRWHPNAFASLQTAFDPATNVDYAARYLLNLYARTGDWMLAAGSYHSSSAGERQTYLAALQTNIAVANGGPTALPPAHAPEAPNVDSAPDAQLAEVLPMPKIAWSASLSADRDSRSFSIYSRQELQPVLPNFTQEF